MKSYLLLVIDHVKTGSPSRGLVTNPVVSEAELPEAIAAIVNVRPLLGVEVVPISAGDAAESTCRWSPELLDALRRWAVELPMDTMKGAPGDPQGRLAALAHAKMLCNMLDGAELQEHANGVTVGRPGAQKPDAFLHFAPLPQELN